MPKLIREMTYEEVRLARILARCEQNAIARSRGFKNFKEWQPNDD